MEATLTTNTESQTAVKPDKYADIIANADKYVADLSGNENTEESEEMPIEGNKIEEVAAEPNAEEKLPELTEEQKKAEEKKLSIAKIKENKIKELKKEIAEIKKQRAKAEAEKDSATKKVLDLTQQRLQSRIRTESLENFFKAAEEEVLDLDNYKYVHKKFSKPFAYNDTWEKFIRTTEKPHEVAEALWTYMDSQNITAEQFLNRSPLAIKTDLQYLVNELRKAQQPATQQAAAPAQQPAAPTKPVEAAIKAEAGSSSADYMDVDKLDLRGLINAVRKGAKNLK